MNRVEAYDILRKHIDLFVTYCADRSLEEDVQGASGIWYRVEIKVVSGTDGEEVHALIHDHNSHWFTMIEERVPYQRMTRHSDLG